jgi:hypothetical protein
MDHSTQKDSFNTLGPNSIRKVAWRSRHPKRTLMTLIHWLACMSAGGASPIRRLGSRAVWHKYYWTMSAVLLPVALVSCAPTFRSYSVIQQPPAIQAPKASPPTLLRAITANAECTILSDAISANTYYVLPNTIEVSPSEYPEKLQSIALLTVSKTRLILSVSFSPGREMLQRARAALVTAGHPVEFIDYYPISHLTMSLITDPEDAGVASATIVPAEGQLDSPFALSLILESSHKNTIATLRNLLKSSLGFVLQGTYSVSVLDNNALSTRTVSVKYTIRNLAISSLSQ